MFDQKIFSVVVGLLRETINIFDDSKKARENDLSSDPLIPLLERHSVIDEIQSP